MKQLKPFLFSLALIACSSPQNISAIHYPQSDGGLLGSTDVATLGLPTLQDASAINQDASPVSFNNQNGETIVPMRQGTPAPFNGVLFNGPAVARVTVEFQAQQQRCLIERNRDVSLISARYNADTASLRLALETQERTANVLLNSRDQDISSLNRLLAVERENNSKPDIVQGLIWSGGGVLVGILVGGIIVYSLTSP